MEPIQIGWIYRDTAYRAMVSFSPKQPHSEKSFTVYDIQPAIMKNPAYWIFQWNENDKRYWAHRDPDANDLGQIVTDAVFAKLAKDGRSF